MSIYSRYIIAATDITARPKLFSRMRGKPAKELYRFAKGVALTQTITGPAIYAAASIPKEMSQGFIYSSIGCISETFIGYISGVGFIRFIYKATDVIFVKNTARVLYNFACLPVTCYCKGVSSVFDLLQLSKIEEAWFGSPVYIFNDNRLWIESNFTLEEAFKSVKLED
jgi:hypothetical protein